MNLVADIQYFPSIIFYKISYRYSHILIEQCESYQKMSFRNRCRIAGAEGVVNLSIPIAGGRDQKLPMREVRIAPRPSWQAQHWKTIVSCYSRSPWFDYYRDGLEKLFEEPAEFLLDWDLRCLEWSLRALGMDRPILLTDVYKRDYDPADAIDWRGRLGPKSLEKWGVGGVRNVASGGGSTGDAVADAAGAGDAGVGISGTGDAVADAAGAGNAAAGDVGAVDAGVGISGTGDAGAGVFGAGDAAAGDAGAVDAGVGISGTGDAAGGFFGAGDAAGGDAGAGDAAIGDAGALAAGGRRGQRDAEIGVARYRQVFEERIGFMSNLSILDLLCCEGKEAIRYIRS